VTQPQPDPNDVLSYALQRRSVITQACELVDSLGLPVERSLAEPDVALRAMAYNWAVNVHPDLMRWYRDAAQATHAKCRILRINNGVDEVTEVEQLVLRDLNVFTAAIDAHLSLPAEMQKRVIDLAEPVHANTALVAPMRLASVLPGVVLLAWDQAWRDAIETFGRFAGEVIQTPAVIDGFQSRIDNLEESVQLMMNRFIAISAVTEIPEEYRRR
jgi:hypothetical protein